MTFSFPGAQTPTARHIRTIWIRPAAPSGDVADFTIAEKGGSGREEVERG
jgi:hypothetical protein